MTDLRSLPDLDERVAKAFFARATKRAREKYGPSANIAMMECGISILDDIGHLGVGETLRDAFRQADETVAARRPPNPDHEHRAVRRPMGVPRAFRLES